MRYFSTVLLSEGTVIDEEFASCENNVKAFKGCVTARFLVKLTRHLKFEVKPGAFEAKVSGVIP